MDAIRLAIVSNEGEAIGEDNTLVLAMLYVSVARRAGSRESVHDFSGRGRCKKFRLPVFLTKIGEVNVTDAMQQHSAVIGGEGNGGVIYPRINFARDSLVGMAWCCTCSPIRKIVSEYSQTSALQHS
jgi:phosphomannomutase